MKRLAKFAVLLVADVAVLYLSNSVAFFLASKVLGIESINDTLTRFPAIFVVMAIKLVIFAAFFMYSMNVYRNLLLDAAGVTVANAAGTAVASLAFASPLGANYIYFIIVFVIEAFFSVITRFLIRGVGVDEYGDDDEEEADLSDSAFYGTVYTGVYRDESHQGSRGAANPAGQYFSDEEPDEEAQKPEYRISEDSSPLPLFRAPAEPAREAAPLPYVQRKSKVFQSAGRPLSGGVEIIEDDEPRTPGYTAEMTLGLAEETEIALDLGADPYPSDPHAVQHPKPLNASERARAAEGPGMVRRAEQMETNGNRNNLESPFGEGPFGAGGDGAPPQRAGRGAEDQLRQEIEDKLNETRALLAATEKEKEQERAAYEALKENMQSELLNSRQEREESLNLLFGALEEKESHIANLEERLKTSQESTDLPQEALRASGNDRLAEAIARQGALEKILEEVRTLYSAIDSRSKVLDNRSKLLEEREYMLVTKMIELDERERKIVSKAPDAPGEGQRKPNPVLEELSSTIRLLDGLAKTQEKTEAAAQAAPSSIVMAPPDRVQAQQKSATEPLSRFTPAPATRFEAQAAPAPSRPESRFETQPKRFDTRPAPLSAAEPNRDPSPERMYGDTEPYRVINPVREPPRAAPSPPPTYRTGKGVPLSVVFDYGPDDVYDDESDFDESDYLNDVPAQPFGDTGFYTPPKAAAAFAAAPGQTPSVFMPPIAQKPAESVIRANWEEQGMPVEDEFYDEADGAFSPLPYEGGWNGAPDASPAEGSRQSGFYAPPPKGQSPLSAYSAYSAMDADSQETGASHSLSSPVTPKQKESADAHYQGPARRQEAGEAQGKAARSAFEETEAQASGRGEGSGGPRIPYWQRPTRAQASQEQLRPLSQGSGQPAQEADLESDEFPPALPQYRRDAQKPYEPIARLADRDGGGAHSAESISEQIKGLQDALNRSRAEEGPSAKRPPRKQDAYQPAAREAGQSEPDAARAKALSISELRAKAGEMGGKAAAKPLRQADARKHEEAPPESLPQEKAAQPGRKNRPDFSQLQNDKMPITAFEFDSLSALIDEI
jgi:hypothetical protein